MLLQLEETGPNTAMVERSLSRGAIRIQNPDHDLGLGVRDPSHLLPLVSAHGYSITMQAPALSLHQVLQLALELNDSHLARLLLAPFIWGWLHFEIISTKHNVSHRFVVGSENEILYHPDGNQTIIEGWVRRATLCQLVAYHEERL